MKEQPLHPNDWSEKYAKSAEAKALDAIKITDPIEIDESLRNKPKTDTTYTTVRPKRPE